MKHNWRLSSHRGRIEAALANAGIYCQGNEINLLQLLGQQFKKQPYGIAAGNLESILGAIFNSSLDETSAGVQSSYASRLMDEYASKYAKKKPKNMPMMNAWIAERL